MADTGEARREAWQEAVWAFLLHALVVLPALICSRSFLVLSKGRGFWPRFLRIENPLVYGLNKWDSAWYLDIAYRGYNRRSAAFFPLYPEAIRLLHRLTGWSLPVSGLVIANLSFLLALVLFYQLVREWSDSQTARRALLYLALFPTSVFFSAGYTESVFLLFVLAAFQAARRGKWPIAAAAAGLAALTRNLGIFLTASLGLEWLQREWRNRGEWSWTASLGRGVWLALIPLALGIHMAVLYRELGEPLAFLTAQRFWQRTLVLPTTALWRGFAGPVPAWSRTHTVIDLIFALGFLALLVRGWGRLPWSEWLYFAFGLLIPLSSMTPFAPLTSLPRYVVVLFPGFALLAREKVPERVHFAACLLFATGLALVTALFSSWYWVA